MKDDNCNNVFVLIFFKWHNYQRTIPNNDKVRHIRVPVVPLIIAFVAFPVNGEGDGVVGEVVLEVELLELLVPFSRTPPVPFWLERIPPISPQSLFASADSPIVGNQHGPFINSERQTRSSSDIRVVRTCGVGRIARISLACAYPNEGIKRITYTLPVGKAATYLQDIIVPNTTLLEEEGKAQNQPWSSNVRATS